MDAFKKAIVPVLLATLWILVSEFVRNELLFSHLWKNHYAQLGLTFPNGPLNGALWGVWSLCYAGVIYIIARRFSTFQATCIAWLAGFVLMWLVLANLNVLPAGLLVYAVPLSMLESFLAVLIIKKYRN